MIGQKNNFYDQLEALFSPGQIGDVASDHVAELNAFQGWNYVAIQALCKQAARAIPRVYREAKDGSTRALRKSLRQQFGSAWQKSLVRGQPAGELVEVTHPLVRLLEEPNPRQTGLSFRWEQIQQLRIHGSCIVWNRPNVLRTRTVQRYVIPMALLTPIQPGSKPDFPRGGVKIQPYRSSLFHVNGSDFSPLRNFYGAELPVEQLSVVRYPHPMLKGDGASPTNAIAPWIDTSKYIDDTRVEFYQEGSNGKLLFTADTSDEEQVESIERKLNDMLGPNGKQCVVIGTPATLALKRTAEELGFIEAFDQMKSGILAGHGVSKPQIGEMDSMTYGSVAASLFASTYLSIQPDMDLIADEDTRDLACDYEGKLTIEYDVPSIEDPELEDRRTESVASKSVMTVREYRTKHNLEPFGNSLDDFILTPAGPVPMDSLLKGSASIQVPPPPAAPTTSQAEQQPGIAIQAAFHEDYPEEELIMLRKAGFRVCDVEELKSGDVFWNRLADGPLALFASKLPPSLQKSQLEALLAKDGNHSYGCVMLELPEQLADMVTQLGSEIPDEWIGAGGRETWPHLTILYGLAGCTLEEVIEKVRRFDAPLVTFRGVSTFPEGKDGVPLKIDIESQQAGNMNQALRAALPHTVSFAEYRPHVTIAYVREGFDAQPVTNLTGRSCRLTTAVVSMPGKPKAYVPLRVPVELTTPPLGTVPDATEMIEKAFGVEKSKQQYEVIVERMQGLESAMQSIVKMLSKE
jgi:2'-5' RNA ligase